MAESSTNPALQESLTDIAHHWMRLASELEAARRLVNQLRQSDTASNGRGPAQLSSVTE
jgi:hypothetical protein